MGENPDNLHVTLPLHKPRIYRPDDKDQTLYGFLRQKAEEGIEQVSFHEIQKGLNWTAGALQATINRCLKEDSPTRIYEATAYSDKNKRLTRIFSLKPFQNAAPVSNLKSILAQQQKLLEGHLIEIEDKVILPLKLDKDTVELLQIISEVAPEIKSVPALFREALSVFLKEHLSPSIKKKAFIALNERKKAKKNPQPGEITNA